MEDGLIILLIIILMFGLMYLWAYSSVYFEKSKLEKLKNDKTKKEELYKEVIASKRQIRDEKKKLFKNRSDEINNHFKWLERLNKEIKQRKKINQVSNN